MNWQGLLIILLAGLVGYFALAVAYVGYVLTHPPRRGYAAALARGWPATPAELPPQAGGSRPFTEWTFRSRGFELPVWDVPGEKPDGPTVIFSNGWGSSRIGALLRLPALASGAGRVLLWEMPAHGDAPGGGICRLGTAEVDDLLTLVGLVAGGPGATPIILAGFSLGAGISIEAATRDSRISGVIAEAPYCLPQTPARNVLRARGWPHRFNLPVAMSLLGICFGHGLRFMAPAPRGRFDRAGLAPRLGIPLRVIHGDADEVSPIEDGRRIARAASDGRIIEIAAGGHTNLWTEPSLVGAANTALRGCVAELSRRSPGRA